MAEVDFDLHCVECGTSLRGVPLAGSCASCGRPVSGTVDIGPLDEESATVSRDLACQNCGYNLRTLPLGSVCPECAMPVHASLPVDALHLANRGWLESIRGGVRGLLAASVGVLAVLVMSALLAPFLGLGAMALSGAAAVTGSFIALIGVLVVLEPEPQPRRARALKRATSAGFGVRAAPYIIILLPATVVLIAGTLSGEIASDAFATVALLAIGTLGAMMVVGVARRLREIARRANRPGTETLARVLVSAVVGWLTVVMILVPGEGAVFSGAGDIVELALIVLLLSGVVIYGLWIAVLVHCHAVLNNALEMSKRWRGAG